jgi:hypothetical protein
MAIIRVVYEKESKSIGMKVDVGSCHPFKVKRSQTLSYQKPSKANMVFVR